MQPPIILNNEQRERILLHAMDLFLDITNTCLDEEPDDNFLKEDARITKEIIASLQKCKTVEIKFIG